MMTSIGIGKALLGLLVVLMTPRPVADFSLDSQPGWFLRNSVLHHKLSDEPFTLNYRLLKHDLARDDLSLDALAKAPVGSVQIARSVNPHNVFPQWVAPTRLTPVTDLTERPIDKTPAEPVPQRDIPVLKAADDALASSTHDQRQRDNTLGDWVSQQVASKPISGVEIVDRVRQAVSASPRMLHHVG